MRNEPAFPNTGNATWSLEPSSGMSLRDWFAGQALAGMCSPDGQNSPINPREMARFSFAIADEMLSARAKLKEAGYVD